MVELYDEPDDFVPVSRTHHGDGRQYCILGALMVTTERNAPRPRRWRRVTREIRWRVSVAWRVLRHGDDECW